MHQLLSSYKKQLTQSLCIGAVVLLLVSGIYCAWTGSRTDIRDWLGPLFFLLGGAGTCALAVALRSTRNVAERLPREKLAPLVQLADASASLQGAFCSFYHSGAGHCGFPYASENFHELFGFAPGDVEHNADALFLCIDREDKPRIDAGLSECARGLRRWREEFRYDHPQKGIIWIEAEFLPLADGAGSVIWRGYAQDITLRKKSEYRLRASHADNLEAMKCITAEIAHELSQPLAASLTYVKSISRLYAIPSEKRPASVEETIENAASQIARAGKIVGQLQEFIAHNETSRTVISLHRSLKIAHRGIFRNHEERGFPVELRLVAENCDVFADRAQIGHVLINLLRNAAEARRSDPEHDLVVSTSSNATHICVEVITAGAELAKQFEWDLDAASPPGEISCVESAVSSSRAIIEAHGGKLWATRTGRDGLLIGFILPLAAQDTAASTVRS